MKAPDPKDIQHFNRKIFVWKECDVLYISLCIIDEESEKLFYNMKKINFVEQWENTPKYSS